jgi:hypothetical protein
MRLNQKCIFIDEAVKPNCMWRASEKYCWRAETGCVYLSDEVCAIILKLKARKEKQS